MARKEASLELSLPTATRTELRRLVTSSVRESGESEDRVVERLVNLGTTGTDDLLSAAAVQQTILWMIIHGSELQQQQGSQAIKVIDKYYQDAGITYKYRLPHQVPVAEGKKHFQSTFDGISKLMDLAEQAGAKNIAYTTVEIHRQLHDIMPTLEPSQDKDLVIIGVTSIIPLRRRWSMDGVPFNEILNNYQQIFQATNIGERGNVQSLEKLQIPDNILRALIIGSRSVSNSNARPYAREFGKVSLGALFVETDENRFGKKALQYLTNLPKGDPLLMRISDGLFFISQHLDLDVQFNDLFKFPKHIDKIYQFQRWMATHMFMPALEPNWQTPTDFDNQVSALIEYYDQVGLGEIGTALYFALNRGPYAEHLAHPEIDIYNAAVTQPVVKEALQQKEQKVGKHRTSIVDRDIHEYLQNHWDKVKQDWVQRFGNTQNLQTIISSFEEYINVDLMSLHTIEIVERLNTYAGERFLRNVQQHEDQLTQTTQMIWNDAFRSDVQVGYALAPNIEHTLIFSQNSLPEIIGLGNIRFVLGENPEDSILFAIETKSPTLTISGAMHSQSGELVEISLRLTEDQSHISTLINHIATAAYHDIIYRQSPQTGEINQPIIKVSQIQQRHQKITAPHIDKPERKRKGISVLRKHRYRIQRKTQPEQVNTTVIHERTWRDPHPSLLANAIPYMQIRRIYMEGPIEEKDEIASLLAKAREKLAKISEDKRTKLPDRFQLEYGYDPVTNEKLNLETWTKGHWWPSKEGEEDEEDSLPTSYKKDYSGSRSALSSLDFMKNWIIE